MVMLSVNLVSQFLNPSTCIPTRGMSAAAQFLKKIFEKATLIKQYITNKMQKNLN